MRYFWLLAACLLLLTPNNGWADLSENSILHANLGQTYFDQGQYADAAEEFKIAIRLNPGSVMAASLYNNLGLSYLKLRDYPLAHASFQKALRVQPGFELYYQNLVKAYREQGSLGLALDRFQQIVKENPQNAEALFILALIAEAAEAPELAKPLFQAFLKLEPNSRLSEAAQSHLE